MMTSEKLQRMTDRSRFERLGNAVLRAMYPELKNLIASGINTKGETIKDPIDAFTNNGSNDFIHIAYTTNDTNLRNKWLNEAEGKEGDLIIGLKRPS